MVTTRQFMRGTMRTMRAIDREARRAESRRMAYEKAAQKQAMLEDAADAADEYEEMIEALTGTHRVHFSPRSWREVAERQFVTQPERWTNREDRAALELVRYKPGWFVRTFGLEGMKRRRLAKAVEDARAADEADYRRLQDEASAANEEIAFAQRLMALEPDAVSEALTKYSELGDLPFSLEGIDISFTEDGRVIAWVDGLELEDLPTHSVSLLQSGKASIKPLPKTRLLELHRENICSAALRVAVEFLQTLPLEQVDVVVLSDLLDRSTGHIRGQPVFHVKVAAQALFAMNLHRVEASAATERLGATFAWSSREGMKPIDLTALGIPLKEATLGGA